MPKLMKFFINGDSYSTNQKITLFELVHYFNYSNSLLVLEYNGLILNKTKWEKIFIKDQDTIEIVTIVGGG